MPKKNKKSTIPQIIGNKEFSRKILFKFWGKKGSNWDRLNAKFNQLLCDHGNGLWFGKILIQI